MQRLNGSDQGALLPAVATRNRPIRQLVKARDVATKLGVSISWVTTMEHSPERRALLPGRRLHVYFIWNPDIHHESSEFEWRKTRKKGAKWSLSANKCIQRTVREHEDFLSEFESLMAGAQATLEATGMQPRRLTEQEMFLEVKRALNPLTSDTRPYQQGLAYESARAQIANVNIEDEQDGHLKVGGLLYSWVSVKEMPDATFSGITRELVGQEFPLVMSAEVTIRIKARSCGRTNDDF